MQSINYTLEKKYSYTLWKKKKPTNCINSLRPEGSLFTLLSFIVMLYLTKKPEKLSLKLCLSIIQPSLLWIQCFQKLAMYDYKLVFPRSLLIWWCLTQDVVKCRDTFYYVFQHMVMTRFHVWVCCVYVATRLSVCIEQCICCLCVGLVLTSDSINE